MNSTSEAVGDLVARLHAAGCVYAEEEARVLLSTATGRGALEAMVERRVAGEPLEHVVGFAMFCGVRVAVDPGVFVPRRRTELLARQAAAVAGPDSVVVDLCCGSGAVAVAVAAIAGSVELHAVDIDRAAVRCARRNLAAVGGQVYQGDLFDPLPGSLRGGVDVLVANVPYVPTADLHLLPTEARRHEPRVALDGGSDGLDVLRRVTAAAPDWLAPGGCLLTELSEHQLPAAVAACADAGLSATGVSDPDLGATVVIGVRGRQR